MMHPVTINRVSWLKYNALFFVEHFLGEKLYLTFFETLEKKLYKKISKEIDSSQKKEAFKIIEHLENEKIEPYINIHYPIIFRKKALSWEASKKWDFNFFKEKYGDIPVVLINHEGLIKDSDQNNNVIPLKEYIVNLKNGRKEYLKFSRILEEKSELIADFDFSWLKKFKTKFSFNDRFYFFMGGKGTQTPIHNGFAHTVFVQIKGKKKWTFFKTSDRLFIEVRPKRLNYFYSTFDSSNPNFSLAKYANPIEITLEEGDVMFFPSFIWHQVENETDSIGVAYKFADFFEGYKSSKMLTLCMLLATKPLFINSVLPFLPDIHNYKRNGALFKKLEKLN